MKKAIKNILFAHILFNRYMMDFVCGGVSFTICRHFKKWPEGDLFEDAGGKACRSCSANSFKLAIGKTKLSDLKKVDINKVAEFVAKKDFEATKE